LAEQRRGSLEGHGDVSPVVGNLYAKYDTKNPIARWLMRRFLGTVTTLARSVSPRTLLEVGCGEGRLCQHLFEQLAPERLEACDVSLERIDPHCDARIQFRTASAYELPYANAEFELVVCCEVLEHLEDPARALGELARVTSRALLVSAPNEPLFRGLNLMRLAYLSTLGNTPGHIQHFSAKSLRRLVSQALPVTHQRRVLPWIVLLAER
jgi:ubiquinone/menaquinone biosynthesis C-methylase UbiE